MSEQNDDPTDDRKVGKRRRLLDEIRANLKTSKPPSNRKGDAYEPPGGWSHFGQKTMLTMYYPKFNRSQRNVLDVIREQVAQLSPEVVREQLAKLKREAPHRKRKKASRQSDKVWEPKRRKDETT
jgi:hypothetical protein